MSPLSRFTTATPATDQNRGAPPSILQRFVRPRPATSGATCDFCTAPTDVVHAHVVDTEERALLCVCRACALLFTGSSGGRYRTVGDEHRRIDPFVLLPQRWNELRIPVGMAFFLVHSRLGTTVAFYPSPGGATECELPLAAWAAVVADNPVLADLRPDVEAALVRVGAVHAGPLSTTGSEAPRCDIVPIDRCYELVGELRLHWRGFDGGQQVRERLGAFFTDLEHRAAGGTA